MQGDGGPVSLIPEWQLIQNIFKIKVTPAAVFYKEQLLSDSEVYLRARLSVLDLYAESWQTELRKSPCSLL